MTRILIVTIALLGQGKANSIERSIQLKYEPGNSPHKYEEKIHKAFDGLIKSDEALKKELLKMGIQTESTPDENAPGLETQIMLLSKRVDHDVNDGGGTSGMHSEYVIFVSTWRPHCHGVMTEAGIFARIACDENIEYNPSTGEVNGIKSIKLNCRLLKLSKTIAFK